MKPSVRRALIILGIIGIAVILITAAIILFDDETFTPKIPAPIDHIILSSDPSTTACYLINDPQEVQAYLRSVSRLSDHAFCEEGTYRLDFIRHTRSVYAMPIERGAEYLYPRGTLTLVEATIRSGKRGHAYQFANTSATRIEALHAALDTEPVDASLQSVKAIIETDSETSTLFTDAPLSKAQLTRLVKEYGFTQKP
jgi:hypothetical protein